VVSWFRILAASWSPDLRRRCRIHQGGAMEPRVRHRQIAQRLQPGVIWEYVAL